ncbi:carbon starvation CstA family protein [Leifsonia sp. LS-T14]|uniref:carbon starvation CstA family protein n=1 Tax=unclassified Leifsonia TaxID=2663824 RepID=UPI0035A622AD
MSTLKSRRPGTRPPRKKATILRLERSGAPVGIVESPPWTPVRIATWCLIALLGGTSWSVIALLRGESINAVWFVLASVCTYAVGYRFYSRFIQRRVLVDDDRRATPAERLQDGRDYDVTDRRVLFGHHFAAIAGAGPLVGPVLAAQMGYLPGTIWIVVGAVVAGAVQDYLVLFFSMRRDGRSLGGMARDELGRFGGAAALLATMVIMLIIVAVLGLVVVNALAESPWGVFSCAMTIPIAMFMGVYLRYLRPGRVTEASVIGALLLLLAIVAGGWVAANPVWAAAFTLDRTTLALALIGYGFAAAVMPVWLMLAPRDYLSTFMKIGTILILAVGILVVRPDVQLPALTGFATTGTGPAFAGTIFPFLFITIACGALSGFHALISSGTTPKLVEKESQTRLIGYGSMLMESFVAVMALVAAICLEPGLYFAMNSSAALTGGTASGAADFVSGLSNAAGVDTSVTAESLARHAADVGEQSLVSRTGGAPTLAVGIAEILHSVPLLGGLKAFWYHFAIMFEALFILTTVDAGTRVARFMLADTVGSFLPRFRDSNWKPGSWIASLLVVAGWGAVLLMGVTDPLGGIQVLFPLFGISNQLLAAIALAVCFAILCRAGRWRWAWVPGIPLVWDAVVTLSASWAKIFSVDPAIGYWANNAKYTAALAAYRSGDEGALLNGSEEAMSAVIRNTAVQGTLSIVFAVLTLAVLAATIAVSVAAARRGDVRSTESPFVPSRRFAPSGLRATRGERALLLERPGPASTGGLQDPDGLPEEVGAR